MKKMCVFCGEEYDKNLKKCPKCNRNSKNLITIIIGIVFIVGLVLIFSNLGADDNNPTDTNLWICTQDLVKSELKYEPSSAKFGNVSDYTYVDLGDREYKVSGTVEAKNGFGTYVKTNFIATFTFDGSGYKNGRVNFY